MIFELFILIVILGFLFTVMYLIWKLPKIQTKGFEDLPKEEKFKLENEARKTLIQLFGGIFFLGTLFFSWNSFQLSKKEQFSKRFSETILLFGNEKINSRVAAIYSLENLANDYKEERETIFQILLAYVKQQAGINKFKNKKYWLSKDFYKTCSKTKNIDKYSIRIDSVNRITSDVQAAINSLIRMKIKYKQETYLEFNNLNLEGLILENVDISKLDFRNSNLNYSDLINVNSKEETLFGNASLKFSNIDGNFKNTNFYRANMAHSIFIGEYENCQFGESNLFNTQFEGGKIINSGFWSSNMTSTFFEGEVEIKNPNFNATILNCADLSMLKVPSDSFKKVIKNTETLLPN